MSEGKNGLVYFIAGRVRRNNGGEATGVHVLLVANDDESAIRQSIQSLAADGYAAAELDRIGEMAECPDDEPYRSAWESALEGEIAIVTFDDPFGDDWSAGR